MGEMVVTDRVIHFWRPLRLLRWERGVNAQEGNFAITIGIDLGYQAGSQRFVLNAYLMMWLKIQGKDQILPFGQLSSYGSTIFHVMVWIPTIFSRIKSFSTSHLETSYPSEGPVNHGNLFQPKRWRSPLVCDIRVRTKGLLDCSNNSSVWNWRGVTSF